MWNSDTDLDEAFRRKVIWGSAAIVVIGLVGAGIYYRYSARRPPAPAAAAAPPVAASAQPAAPAIQNRVPTIASAGAKPLPALNQSDADMRDALVGLYGARTVEQLLVPENIVRHIVVTIDNMPRRKVAVDLRPVKPTAGETVTTSQGDTTLLGAANYARYAPFIKAVQSTDAKTLADVYFRLYPLFQQAYEDLGYPGQYFNDRLVAVIDDLLKTPDVKGPIELKQPKVFFEYADPRLESLSSGQKLLLRMGPENAAVVKAKLRELRKAVTTPAEQPVTH
ncbi:MAG TPA: DUF3014 domain-containing protein [Steroidobacteraceae bacterium]